MTTILWNEDVPSGESLVAQAPAFWRSEQTSLALGLATDLYWDGSGGASEVSRGELKPGASRAYFNVSLSSMTESLARPFFPSNNSALFVSESNATHRFAGPFVYEYGSGASLGWALSNVSMFRELSGFTSVSNVTNAGGSPVNSVAVIGANFNAVQQFCSVTCSERSVVFNVFGTNSSFSDSVNIYYQALDSTAPSTATFYWTCTMLTVGLNDPAGAAL